MNVDGSASNVKLSTRLRVWWDGVPLVVRSILIVMLAIFLWTCIFPADPQLHQVCFNAPGIFTNYQVYRMITGIFFHVNILHIALNMMSFIGLAIAVEHKLGSVGLFCTTFVLALIASSIELTIASPFVLSDYKFLPELAKHVIECAIGFSGVIFAYLILVVTWSPDEPRSVFGFFTVSPKFYPWVSLFVAQMILPGVSFLGHLCGILAGYIYIYLIHPRQTWHVMMHNIERRLPRFITGRSAFMTSAQLPTSVGTGSSTNNANDSYGISQAWDATRTFVNSLGGSRITNTSSNNTSSSDNGGGGLMSRFRSIFTSTSTEGAAAANEHSDTNASTQGQNASRFPQTGGRTLGTAPRAWDERFDYTAPTAQQREQQGEHN